MIFDLGEVVKIAKIRKMVKPSSRDFKSLAKSSEIDDQPQDRDGDKSNGDQRDSFLLQSDPFTSDDTRQDLEELQREIYLESLEIESLESDKRIRISSRWLLDDSEKEQYEKAFDREDTDKDGLLSGSFI